MLLFYPFIYGKMIVWKMMMSKLFKPATLAVAILSAVASSQIFAKNDADLPTLEPIVVTVSKTEQPISTAPARIYVIDKKTIEQNPTLNLSDILKNDASVFNRSQWGGIGQPSSLSVRGTNATHTLVLKDGARLNSQNGTSPLYPAFIDLTDVQQIEILKGSASVQYGSDAIGGVVQMVSKAPEKTGAFVTGTYGENDTYKAVIGGDFVADNGIYAQVRGQKLESDGNRIFNTQEKHQKAGYEQKGYSAKLGYNKQNLGVSLSVNQNKGINIFSADGMINVAPRYFENQVMGAVAKYHVNKNMILSARHSIIKDKQNVPNYSSYYNTKTNETDLNTQWSFLGNQNVLIGATLNQSEYLSNTITDAKQKTNTKGYYIQHQYNSDKVHTQFGIRLEDNKNFGHHVVGQSAIRYHITPTTSVYTNIGSAFRAPTLDEMYSSFYTDNPNLKPEKSMAYELGLNHNITTNLDLDLSVYRNKVNNLIRSTCIAQCDSLNWWERELQNINIDKALFTGGELGLKWANDNLFASAQYAYVNAQEKSKDSINEGKQLAYRPKHHGVMTLGYDDGKYGVNTTVTVHAKSYANPANTVKVGGYTTADVNFHWNVNPNVKFFGSVQNIGDVQYKSSNYFGNQWYINGGRQTNIGVTLKY